MSKRLCLPAVLALLALGCATPRATMTDRVEFVDPAADDHGPGGYVYPQGERLQRGDLDLRAVRLSRQGDELVVEAEFQRRIAVARGVRLAREQRADLFLAAVDVYLDVGPGGARDGLPGRRVSLPSGRGWELAVVLTAIPSRLSEVLSAQVASGQVVIPRRVKVRGRVLEARLPAHLLGGVPLADLGIAVAVTGTAFGSTFRSEVEGMMPNAFVRGVTPRAGRCDRWSEAFDGAPCTFGGCGDCQGHPRVLDALHPVSGTQERSLSTWGPGGQAVLPMVGGTLASEPAPPVLRASIIDARPGLVTARVPREGAPLDGHIIDGLDAEGAIVATLVVQSRVERDKMTQLVLQVVGGDGLAVERLEWRVPPPP